MIATLRTPKEWPRPAVVWFRAHVRAHFMSGKPAGTDGHQPKAAWVGLGLVTLVILTTGVVAWVSIWWVPAYLLLMVLIFVTPPRFRQPLLAVEPDEESADEAATDLTSNLRIDSAEEGEYTHLGVERILGLLVGETAAEFADSRTDFASSAVSRPRRSRGRARRVAKLAAETVPESTPAMWIRVGPGKFVRADTHIHSSDQAVAEDPLTDPLATDVSGEDTCAPTAPAVLGLEQYCLPPWAVSFTGDEIAIASNDLVQRSVTKEHGITPSTFGPIVQVSTSANGLENDGFGAANEPQVDSVSGDDLDANTSCRAVDSGRRIRQARTSSCYVGLVSRRIANAIPDADQASPWRNVRHGSVPRTQFRSSSVPNTRLQQAARRAFGRLPHIQCPLRPRSPPDR